MTVLEKTLYRGKVFTRYADDPNYFYGKVYERTTKKTKFVPLHRYIWEDMNGKIPDDCLIHHIDGNPLNNDISNLACILIYDHLSKFHGERKYKNAVERFCQLCGQPFKAKTKRSFFCCRCAALSPRKREEIKARIVF